MILDTMDGSQFQSNNYHCSDGVSLKCDSLDTRFLHNKNLGEH